MARMFWNWLKAFEQDFTKQTYTQTYSTASRTVADPTGSDPAALTSSNPDAATVAALTAGSAQVIVTSTAVDASGGGSAQTTNCTVIPANSILLGVHAQVVTPFDGDTTQTLEVGVGGNADNYIDTSDFDPSAAAGTDAGSLNGTNNDMKYAEWIDDETTLVATWTNDSNATAGNVLVKTVHVCFDTTDLDTQFDAIIADVAELRTELTALRADVTEVRSHQILNVADILGNKKNITAIIDDLQDMNLAG